MVDVEERSQRDHDEWVAVTQRTVASVSLADVGAAFVASLSSRRKDLRSALGSYGVALRLPTHTFTAGRWSPSSCGICGLQRNPCPLDINVLDSERIKFGGVRHADLRYASFDLEQFRATPKLTVQAEDVVLGRQLLDVLRGTPANETATAAVHRLRVIKGNMSERGTIMEILGHCGVLQPASEQGRKNAFVHHDSRNVFLDMEYPAASWRGRDGVNMLAVQTYLPVLA